MELANPTIAARAVSLLDDSHDTGVPSFENARSFFGQAGKNFTRRIVVAGRFAAVEGDDKNVYGAHAQFISDCDPFAVILLGDGLEWLGRALQNDVMILRATTPNDVLALLETLVDENTALLLQGSGSDTRMQRLSSLLKSGEKEFSTRIIEELPELRERIRDGINSPRELSLSRGNEVSIGFLGDTYFGEYYAQKALASGKPHPLHSGDYEGWIAGFDSFLSANALNFANLETPLTELEASPYQEQRPYPHRADPKKTLRALTRAGINAVTLGNNHLFDYGRQGIVDTLSQFHDSSIAAIGAGENATDAARPLAVRIDRHEGAADSPTARELLVFSGFAYRRVMDEHFEAYAKAARPGCNPVNKQTIAAVAFARRQHPHAFIVAVPHWQRDYLWTSLRQRSFAHDVLAVGADLMIGHGSHMLQQIERFGGRLAVHSLGNFIFHSPGRSKKMFAPPISAVARLVFPADPARPGDLRLYPIFTDNRTSGYRTRLLGEEEFSEHMSRYIRLGFLPRDAALKRDGIGNYVEMALQAGPERV